MIIIATVLCLSFILMICMICKGYHDDIIDIENRMLQLEKRIVKCEKRKKSDD